jgi:hypothetical protein
MKHCIVDDSLGRWVLVESKEGRGEVCNICGTYVSFLLRPHTRIVLPESIDPRRTLLARGTTVGLTCGCYAKLHRQIAHIQDAMRRR